MDANTVMVILAGPDSVGVGMSVVHETISNFTQLKGYNYGGN